VAAATLLRRSQEVKPRLPRRPYLGGEYKGRPHADKQFGVQECAEVVLAAAFPQDRLVHHRDIRTVCEVERARRPPIQPLGQDDATARWTVQILQCRGDGVPSRGRVSDRLSAHTPIVAQAPRVSPDRAASSSDKATSSTCARPSGGL
jgi:hypothetical protein